MPRRLTDQRRFSKDGKLALAAWLGIKFAFGNSTLYNISTENLMRFFHIRRDRAKHLARLMWEDGELFYVNKKKNCVFAKSCRNKSVYATKRGDKSCYDDVMTIPVPEGCLKEKNEKEFLPLEMLVRLIERVLVCKEYDDQTGYKYSTGDQDGCSDNCATEVRKTQLYVARRTGLSRTKVGRILREYVSEGLMTKTPQHIERCHKGERYAFKALNKRTHLEYFAKCVPPTFSWVKDMPFQFKNLIWNAVKRRRSKFPKSEKRLKKEIAKKYGYNITQEELSFKIMAEREIARRMMFD